MKGECTELVAVHLELLQRRRQHWDPGELVVIEVQLLQRGQALRDTQQKQRHKTDKMDASLQIHNFPSRLAKQDTVTEFTEINQLREFKIRASLPCRLSCRIFSKATLCGSPVKAAVVGVCQVKAVD